MTAESNWVSMTYGQLPSFDQFEAAFDRECPNGEYPIELNSSDSRACDDYMLGSGSYRCSELYQAISEIVLDFESGDIDIDHGALDLVSSILQTLQFEWI